jgi:hypothetical protein
LKIEFESGLTQIDWSRLRGSIPLADTISVWDITWVVGFKIDQMIQNRPYRFVLVIYYRPPDQDLTAEEREGGSLTGLGSGDEFLARAALVINVGGFPMICDGNEDVDGARKRTTSSYM